MNKCILEVSLRVSYFSEVDGLLKGIAWYGILSVLDPYHEFLVFTAWFTVCSMVFGWALYVLEYWKMQRWTAFLIYMSFSMR